MKRFRSKKWFLGVLILIPALVACSNVKAGQVGVRTGPSGRVLDCGVGPGTHWTGFGGMKTFTTRLQYSYLTAAPSEGDKNGKDDVTVTSSEGAIMSADLQIGYLLKSDKDTVCRVFKTLARDDNEVRDLLIRPAVRAVAPAIFGGYHANEARTTKRVEIAGKIKDSLNARFLQDPLNGFINVDSVLVGDVRVSPQLQTSIDAAIKADADAVTADKERQAALTRAETARQEAEKQAQTTAINAAAQADKNQKEASSMTPDLAQLRETQACADAIAKTQAQVVNCGPASSSGSSVIVQPKK